MGTNSRTTNDYYESIRISLKTIGKVIADEEKDLIINLKAFTGRKGSSYFEDDFLKPLIRKHSEQFCEKVSENLKDNSFEFVKIEAPKSFDESSARSFADVSVVIKHPDGAISEEYVNIKATSGNTADNVGSWQSLNHVLYGNKNKIVKNRTQLLERIANEPLGDQLSDYFLWVFNKSGPKSDDLLRNASVHSMLGSSLKDFKINMSQNYPIQFNSHRAEQVLFDDTFTITTARNELLKKILSNGIEFYGNQLGLWTKALKSLEQS